MKPCHLAIDGYGIEGHSSVTELALKMSLLERLNTSSCTSFFRIEPKFYHFCSEDILILENVFFNFLLFFPKRMI